MQHPNFSRSPAYHLRILRNEQLGTLKTATLAILQETGVHCPSEKALKIYAEHGAQVDFAAQVVKLAPEVVLEAMSHAPRFYTMGARSPAMTSDWMENPPTWPRMDAAWR